MHSTAVPIKLGSLILACTATAAAAFSPPLDELTFHHDPQRTGWISNESTLTPQNVSSQSFGLIWQSAQLDGIAGAPPRIYASPLYMDRLRLTDGPYKDRTLSVVFTATNAGFVYAINASAQRHVPVGTILWKRQLAPPCIHGFIATSDGIPAGVMSTPVIDPKTLRLYVTSCTSRTAGDRSQANEFGDQFYEAYALDATSGRLLPGWPVSLDRVTLNSPGVNKNAADAGQQPVRPETVSGTINDVAVGHSDFNLGTQRGALNLSPDGSLLYATFGESIPGWVVAVDTSTAKVASAFASVAVPHGTAGGIWGAGGAAIDMQGNVFVIVGTAFGGYLDQPHDWVQSALMFPQPASDGFTLRGTYTPFNYCHSAMMDIDVGSGGAILLPDLDPLTTSTPHLMAFGGKQGNLYLVNRTDMPGRLDGRQACSDDASSDTSLLSPNPQLQFGKSGPLNIFGPYSEDGNAVDQAKSRSVPAYFSAVDGRQFLFVSGSSKKDEHSDINVPPCLARVKVVVMPGKPAYLEVDQLEQTVVLENPGSPVVTSHGSMSPIVWVLDEHAHRSTSLAGPNAPRPVLYAFDALTLRLLWNSEPGELSAGGKYSEPAIARGTVFVATDRVQAFGLRKAAR
jgi:hypothetical protein